jgi:hypothetical protein
VALHSCAEKLAAFAKSDNTILKGLTFRLAKLALSLGFDRNN